MPAPAPSPRLPPGGGTRPRALLLASRLCAALRAEDERAAAALLQEGADPNAVLPGGVAAVHLAAGVEQGRGLRRLGLLLQHGGDPNARSGDGLTPVHVAASWGCASCLTLLLMEGGDPRLEDQDGNTALDLALEQGNEACASILQGEWRRSSWSSQRRAESFLSTLSEDARETGAPASKLCDGPPTFSPKEAPPSACSQGLGDAASSAPGSGQDRSTSSFLSEVSWQATPCAPSSLYFSPSKKGAGTLGPSPAAGGGTGSQVEVEPEAHRPCDLPESCLFPSLQSVRLCDSPPLLPKPPSTADAPEQPPDPPGLATRSEMKADTPLGLQEDGRGSPPSWLCSFHDPPLVRLTSQLGLDGSWRDPAAPSDLEREAGETPTGCSARGGSWSGSSAGSLDFVSCLSDWSAGGSRGPADWKDPLGWGPGCSKRKGGASPLGSGPQPPAEGSVGRGAAGEASEGGWLLQEGVPHRQISARTMERRQDSVLCSSRDSESHLCPPGDELLAAGAEQRESRAGRAAEDERRLQGSVLAAGEEANGRRFQGRPRDWRQQRGSLQRPGGAQGAKQKPPSPQAQGRLPTEGASEEETPSQGPAKDSQAALQHSAEEEALASLDRRLQSMTLASKAFRSPLLLQSPQKHCHVTLRPRSPLATRLPEGSASPSSLSREGLEVPRQGRGTMFPSGARAVALSGRSPPPTAGGAREAGRVGPIPAAPGDSKPALGTLSCPVAGPAVLRNPGGQVESAADSGAGLPTARRTPPSSANGKSSGSALAQQRLEGLHAPWSHGHGPGEPSRVSFSRLSAWDPLGVGPPGRAGPSCPGILLSPGGRPVNLSASHPAEYLYLDFDQGHALVERHVPPTEDAVAGSSSLEEPVRYDWRACASQGRPTQEKPWPPADGGLAQRPRGVCPRPPGTADGLKSDPRAIALRGSAAYSPELTAALETLQIPESRGDEAALARQFDQPDKSRRWREGLLKSSFNYLLLDPRVTQNLPLRSWQLSPAESFQTFVGAIFYVGKGKRSRPYCHLYEALAHRREGQKKACAKIQHILAIWASGQGVVSVHCFQNAIPVEAYTREACMVDALGLQMLTNQKRGNYYGTVAGWPMKRRRRLGVHLLYRAMQIFLAEGERQLHPADL